VASHARIWGQTRCLGAGGTNRGTDTIFDVRHTGGKRSTSNVQLSRFNGVTERGHVGRDMGTDTICGGRLMLPGHPDMGTGTISWGQARYHGDKHDVGYTRYGDRHDARYTDQERLTSNVQLSTFNGVTERAHVGRDMGTDTICGGRLMLPGHPDMGTGTISWGQARCRVYPIWGQTRCPVYRSGTFNGQRSTLNFQRGDRKGACWSGYGDRHDMWWPADAARAPEYGDRHDIMGTGTMSGIPDMGTDTMPGIPIRNV